MPVARFQMPDGRIARFEVPEGTTPEQAQAMIAEQVQQEAPKPSVGQMFAQEVKQSMPGRMISAVPDFLAGAVRGAGSIGATILSPIDAAARAMGVQNDLIGRTDRRQAMTDALASMGADTGSLGFTAGKIAGEVAGTAGVPSALAGAIPARAISSLSAVSPRAAEVAPLLVNSLRSGGSMLGGTFGNRAVDLAARMAGGAVAGGAAAGLVNPEEAGVGAIVGAAAPAVLMGAAAAGKKAGEKAAKKAAEFARKAPQRETLQNAIDAGYVVPPNMVNPSTTNALIESFSGKQATSQIASVRNQQVTEKLVRQSLGLADDAPLTKGALEQIRTIEGGAYKRIADLSPQAANDLEALKIARNEAQAWFNAYNRSASPVDLAKAKELRSTADALEKAIEGHAIAAGKDELVPALRAARQNIAKTYTVQRALNEAGGTVNARVLGRLYEKGTPLSGDLATVGRFASAFPSVAQAPQQMGSPAAHNLRAMASLAMGGAGSFAAGPVGLAAGAVPLVAGPLSRSIMFRQGAQQALARGAVPASSDMALLLQDPTMQMLLSRTAPIIAADRQ